MKKRILLFVLLPLLTAAPLLGLPGGWEAGVSTQFGSSIVSRYINLHASLVHQQDVAGFGGGIKNVIGISEGGYYIAPYARLEIGPFYLGTGASIPLAQPSQEEAATAELAPFGTIGVFAAPWAVGTGSLGFDISIDAIFTAVPQGPDGETEVEKITGAILSTLLGAIKGSVGIAYSF